MPNSSAILYHGRNRTDNTVIISINGAHWEYWLQPQQCDTVEYLAKRVSAGKALAFAKAKAQRSEHLR